MATPATDIFDKFEKDWVNIDDAFRWAATEAETLKNPEAARICVEFVNKASLWSLNMWRPKTELYEWLQKGRAAAEAIQDTAATAGILNNIGIILVELGKPREALSSHGKAQTFAVEHGHALEATHAASSIGICYRHLGERERALDSHRRALNLAESGGFEHLCLNCHGNIALVLAEMETTYQL